LAAGKSRIGYYSTGNHQKGKINLPPGIAKKMETDDNPVKNP